MKYLLPILISFFLVGCSYNTQPSTKNVDKKVKITHNALLESYENFLAKTKDEVEKKYLFEFSDKELESIKPTFYFSNSIDVTATAYNSLKGQTDSRPSLAAWGDVLEPGMKVIAVSRDLLDMGLTHNTKVKISGLDGIFIVKDKMAKRWRKKIDIYMGKNRRKAINWGERKVEIMW